ncbi:alpha/beta hydrolase [Altererythrobacter sp. BO-6]|uniref:alpha/beta fold hydrolase n=1 Tax=Altererythrobacter sp. BO-6 TaxID=2604537 RepID=UPI0013E1DFBB|nr:alpha/beta fold hydrolase [Altererythrobacter sp. BO-6]QIG53583.1 alpha/beta hydrolase [Altererythrobacter sp. BO-6]
MIGRRRVLAGLGLAGAFATFTPARALPDPPNPAMRRQYVDGAFGQIHLRIADPSGASATANTLVLLHQTALSGRMFERFMPYLARQRRVIAVDTPGYGESDRPSVRPNLAGYADAITEAIQAVAGERFDVLGYHTGAAIAADMAARREEVAKCVLVSMPYFSAERRDELIAMIGNPDDPIEDYAEDGSHLLPLWQGSFRARADGQSNDDIARLVAEKQRAGRFGAWALLSALEASLAATLASIEKPVLVLAPHDGLQAESRAAASAIRDAALIELPDHAYGLFDVAPAIVAAPVLAFLDR